MADERILDKTTRTSPELDTSYLAIDHTTNGVEKIPLSQLTGTSVVVVNSMTDFPAPSAGVITLAANTLYLVSVNTLSTSDRFVFGADSVISGPGGTRIGSITYTGSAAMFTSLGVSISLMDMSVTCSSGQIFDIDSNSVPFRLITMSNVTCVSCDSIGTNAGMAWNVKDFAVLDMNDGLAVTGSGIPFFNMRGFNWFDTDAASTGLDLGTATFDKLVMSDGAFHGLGTGLSGTTASANITSGHIASISDVEFNDIVTPLSGVSREDFRFSFRKCAGILDSFRGAEATLTTQQTVTINTQDVFEVVNGVNWTDKISDSWTISTAGVLTHIGEVTRAYVILVQATVEKDSGGSDIIAMRIAQNGTDIADSESRSQSSDPTTITSQTVISAALNDTVNTMVANRSGTGNINVDLSNIIIFRMV